LPPPLRKLKPDASPYFRPAEVEEQLRVLEQLPRDDLLKRCLIRDRAHPDYVRTECVMHFVRACHRDNSEARFASLYRILMERAMRSLPRSEHPAGVSSSQAEINESALDNLILLISSDRETYSERLDFFEIRFDGALVRRRTDAQRKVWRRQKRSASLDDEETGELSTDVEKAANYNPFETEKIEDRDYRSRLDGAIDTLPPLQQRIIHMLRKDVPIDSKDPYAVTISKTLNKVEKTIRNNRDKAYVALKHILEGDRS
jgi:hypothetical protein